MALKIEVVKAYPPGEFGVEISRRMRRFRRRSVLARTTYLAGNPTFIEFLPPKVPAWKQYADKYGTGRARKAMALAAACW